MYEARNWFKHCNFSHTVFILSHIYKTILIANSPIDFFYYFITVVGCHCVFYCFLRYAQVHFVSKRKWNLRCPQGLLFKPCQAGTLYSYHLLIIWHVVHSSYHTCIAHCNWHRSQVSWWAGKINSRSPLSCYTSNKPFVWVRQILL